MSRSVPTAVAGLAVLAAAVAPAAATAASPSAQVSAAPISKPLSTKATSTKITVQNTGKARLSGLTLTVSGKKGVTIRLAGARKGRSSRKLSTLKAGRGVRVGVSLRRTSKGPKKGTLGLKVTRKGKTIARGKLAFGPGTTAPPADPNSLEGRYFWGSRYTVSGIQQNTLYFTGPNLVFVADTESAWPTCTAVSETCKPYSYDAAKKQLTIDGKPATLTGRKLELDGDNYLEFGYPAAGARWDTKVTYSNSSGICPLYCSYYTENLTFLPDGRFVRDAVASGTGPVVDWASVPPDSKGTYEVRADHTLRLAFEDGKERIETVGLYLNDDGTLQAAGEGMVLGGDGYFDIRDK
ncbi:hypothetical protein [Patulibacter defluvii]|uniref:hypothetical protein n=1 Tax=Patulibacter defluvii TaxID=3095358 RepID=UPI002A760567|nr:hypothetical protein [Patulibacter sp. DM4]